VDAAAYFNGIRITSARIEEVSRTLSALRQCECDYQSWKTKGAGGGHGGGTTSDPTARMAEAHIGLPDLIASTQREYEALADEIADCGHVLEVISREVSPTAATALELWAIDRAGTWSEVAEEMQTSRRAVCRARDLAYAWANRYIVFANHNCPRFLVDC
jgi:hypothetical protein